jgi:hypothetical protein
MARRMVRSLTLTSAAASCAVYGPVSGMPDSSLSAVRAVACLSITTHHPLRAGPWQVPAPAGRSGKHQPSPAQRRSVPPATCSTRWTRRCHNRRAWDRTVVQGARRPTDSPAKMPGFWRGSLQSRQAGGRRGNGNWQNSTTPCCHRLRRRPTPATRSPQPSVRRRRGQYDPHS